MLHFAILGAGHIAEKMARTILGMKEQGRPVELYAVASRSLGKARQFAEAWQVSRAYGSYEEMLQDPQVDLVYVATPHSHHAAHTRLCVDYGKAALVEKSFTANAKQAEDVLAYAREKGVLVAEAIWTRYMPSRKIIDDLIAGGAIGEPRVLTANLGYAVAWKERITSPALGGGALLDLGVYALNFASMVFGDDVERMESSVGLMDTGVDHSEAITLYYRDGRVAMLQSTALVPTDRHGVIYGDKGAIQVDNINNPLVITVYDDVQQNAVREVIHVPQQITGYEYEVEACMRALEKGEAECPDMPHSQIVHIMKEMDALRAQWGMVFPGEEA